MNSLGQRCGEMPWDSASGTSPEPRVAPGLAIGLAPDRRLFGDFYLGYATITKFGFTKIAKSVSKMNKNYTKVTTSVVFM